MSKAEVNTKELIQGLKAKDKNAFDTLYDNYSDQLYGLALKITKKKDIAEDVMQETFVKVFKKAESFDENKGTLFTWMLNICRNASIDKIRYGQESRKIQIEEQHVNIEAPKNPESKRFDSELWEVLEKLEDEHKELLMLSYYYGYSHGDISKKLDMPLGTVKSKIRIAIRELRKIYP